MEIVTQLEKIAKDKRQSQIEMAELIGKLIEEKGIGFIEAGTGTGKSFAYLLPAILSGKRVVISTAKKALQTQLVVKDIPFLLSKITDLPKKPTYAQLKGKGNYGCLLNTYQALESNSKLRVFSAWLETSVDADLALFPHPMPFMEDVVVTECTWKHCSHLNKCAYIKNKTAAREADVLVINHSLLAYDFALGQNSLLGPYDILIIDEAHQVSEFFRDALSCILSMDFFKIKSDIEIPNMLSTLIESLFSGLKNKDGKVSNEKLRPVFKEIKEELEPFIEYLKSHGDFNENEEASTRPDITLLSKNLNNLLRQSKIILGEIDGKFVTYYENEQLITAPLNIGGFIGPILKNIPTVVLTSATLATNKNFTFISRDLGLTEKEIKVQKILPSPFDLKNMARIYVTRNTPDPSQIKGELYYDRMSKAMLELIYASNGGAFILCTSKNDMYSYYERFKLALNDKVLIQGYKLEPQVEKFKSEPNLVLIGVKSLWEGVDVPGLGLRLVIIPKLPFPTPNDVVLNEKKAEYIEYLEEAGVENASLKAWSAFDLQKATIDLKQGFGRLIRSNRDAGVVAILDCRVVVKSYGTNLLNELNTPVSYSLESMKGLLKGLSGKV